MTEADDVRELVRMVKRLSFCRESGTAGFDKAIEILETELYGCGVRDMNRDTFLWPYWSVSDSDLRVKVGRSFRSVAVVPVASAGSTSAKSCEGRAIRYQGAGDVERGGEGWIPIHEGIPSAPVYRQLQAEGAQAQLFAIPDNYFRELPYAQLGEAYFGTEKRCPAGLVRESDVPTLENGTIVFSVVSICSAVPHHNLYADFGPAGLPVHVTIIAHLDSAPFSPGAQDNASGCAIAACLAGKLAAAPPAKRVRIVWTVGEETDFFGAFEHIQSHQDELSGCILAINLDPCCSGVSDGTTLLTIGTEALTRWTHTVNVNLSRPCRIFDLAQEAAEENPNVALNGDSVAFATHDIPGLWFHRTASGTGCHTPDDTPDKVGEEQLYDVLEQSETFLQEALGIEDRFGVNPLLVRSLNQYLADYPGL